MRRNYSERTHHSGFVIEGTLAIVFLISAATLAVFTLTPAKNLVNIGGGNGQKTTQTQSYKETIEPYTVDGKPAVVKLPDGSDGLLFKRVKSSESLDERVEPKLTLWQKIMRLGWWWLVLTVAGMFFAPVGFVMNAINGKAKKAALFVADQIREKHEEMVSDARKVVVSVDKGLDVFDSAIASANAAADSAKTMAAATTDPALLTSYNAIVATQASVAKALTDTKAAFLKALSVKQDESTKLLVSQLRNGQV